MSSFHSLFNPVLVEIPLEASPPANMLEQRGSCEREGINKTTIAYFMLHFSCVGWVFSHDQ